MAKVTAPSHPPAAAPGADLLAALAGVNYGSVLKIFAAIEIARRAGRDIRELVDYANAPEIPARTRETVDTQRATCTINEINAILRRGYDQGFEHLDIRRRVTEYAKTL